MARLVIEPEISPHKKKRGKHIKKPWKIECLYIGEELTGKMAAWRVFGRDWHVCGFRARVESGTRQLNQGNRCDKSTNRQVPVQRAGDVG